MLPLTFISLRNSFLPDPLSVFDNCSLLPWNPSLIWFLGHQTAGFLPLWLVLSGLLLCWFLLISPDIILTSQNLIFGLIFLLTVYFLEFPLSLIASYIIRIWWFPVYLLAQTSSELGYSTSFLICPHRCMIGISTNTEFLLFPPKLAPFVMFPLSVNSYSIVLLVAQDKNLELFLNPVFHKLHPSYQPIL